MEQTREDIIDLKCMTEAVLRKAQCRAVDCDIIDALALIAKTFLALDDRLTEMIGD